MTRERKPGECLVPDGLLREYFPYARVNDRDELVIPKRHIDAFVNKYQEIAESRDHLERLAAYRAQGTHKTQDHDDD